MNLQPQLDVITLAYVNQRRRRRHAFVRRVCDVEPPLLERRVDHLEARSAYQPHGRRDTWFPNYRHIVKRRAGPAAYQQT